MPKWTKNRAEYVLRTIFNEKMLKSTMIFTVDKLN